MTHLDFTRRGLLGGAAALSAAGSAGFARGAFAAAAPKLPARGNFVIRKAYVMTMEKDGDIKDGDVHVRDGVDRRGRARTSTRPARGPSTAAA